MKFGWEKLAVPELYSLTFPDSSNMDWIENLKNLLAREAELRYNPTVLSKEDFEKYLVKLTTVTDFKQEFINSTYDMYLHKISQTAEELLDKVCRN